MKYKKAEVNIKWPNTVLIQVKEHKRIAYLKQDKYYFPVLENGKILKDRQVEEIPVNCTDSF